MAGVRIERPWSAWAAAMVSRFAPRTTAAWAVLTACLALPVAILTALATWVVTRPGLSVEVMLVFLRDRAADLVLSFAGDAATTAMESTLAVQLAALIEKILA